MLDFLLIFLHKSQYIYKNYGNPEISFPSNLENTTWLKLKIFMKYYIAKRLAKTLITNLTPKTYNWGSKQTKVPNYICAQRVKYILIPSIQQKS